MQVTIDAGDIGGERIELVCLELRRLKAWHEDVIGKRMREGKVTMEQASGMLRPLGDALNLCGLIGLAVAEASAPGLADVQEYESLAAAPEVKTAGWPVTGGVIKNVAAENEASCGDCRVPRCRFCDQPGQRAGARKDGLGRIVERYYTCATEGCIAAKVKTPQPTKLFSGGAE